MNDKKSLLGNGTIYLISSILIKGIVFLTMPLFTKLMSVEDFGIYNAYMSYEAILSIIMTIGAAVVVRNAWIEYADNFPIFEKAINQILFLWFFIILLFLMFFEILTRGGISELLGLSSILLVCLLFHSSGYGLVIMETEKYRMEFKAFKVLGLSLAITVSSIIISLVLIDVTSEKYTARIIGSAIPYILFWIIYFIKYNLQTIKPHKSLYKYVLTLGLPAVPYILCENIMLQSDRIMIERFIGAYEAGIYSTVSTVASIIMIVGNALDNVWCPWSYKMIQVGNIKKLKLTSTYYHLLYAFICIGFGMIAPELIKIFTSREDYWKYSWLIYPMILMLFLYLTSRIPSNLLLFYKKTKYIAAMIFCTTILNIILNYCCFRIYNFQIAAVTSLISMFLLTVIQYILCSYFKIKIYFQLKILLISIITIIVIFCEYLAYQNPVFRYTIGISVEILILLLILKKFDLIA